MNFFIDDIQIQSFNTFLPSLAIITLDYRGRLIASTVSMYPESPQKTRICLDTYTDSEFPLWQKLLRIPQLSNKFRDRLIFEDIFILNNLYTTFDKKITLKNDTPAELAMNYLENWDC